MTIKFGSLTRIGHYLAKRKQGGFFPALAKSKTPRNNGHVTIVVRHLIYFTAISVLFLKVKTMLQSAFTVAFSVTVFQS